MTDWVGFSTISTGGEDQVGDVERLLLSGTHSQEVLPLRSLD